MKCSKSAYIVDVLRGVIRNVNIDGNDEAPISDIRAASCEHSLRDGLPNPNARLLIADVLPVTHATMKPDILTMSKQNTGTLHIRNALIKKRNDE